MKKPVKTYKNPEKHRNTQKTQKNPKKPAKTLYPRVFLDLTVF
jgi:hypothetical protein